MVIDFNDLPPEMVLAIVSRLSYGDICNCLMLNKKTRSIINANLHLVPRTWITSVSLDREGASRFKLSVSRNSFKSAKKNWSCVFNETTVSTMKLGDITDFYNNEGFCGMKWDKANKSTEFDVPSISTALEEHLIFVLRANVLCFKLVDLEGSDMEVVTRVLRRSKSKVSHLQLVVNRMISQEIVSLIDATGAETIDIVLRDSNFFQNLPFQSHVLRKAWSVTVRSSSADGRDLLDISDEDLLSLDADSIELFGVTNISVHGARKLIHQWLHCGRKISLVYYRHSEDYQATELLRGIPHKSEALPIVITRTNSDEELKVTWDSSKFRCFTDEADNEADDEYPDLM